MGASGGLSRTGVAVAAGLAAAGAFLALYLGAGLAWWAAVLLGAATYGGATLALPRRASPALIAPADDVTEADLAAALDLLDDGAARMGRLAARARGEDGAAFARMATLLARIREHHERDPADLRRTRRFLRGYLPRMLDSAESYADLAVRADAADPRLDAVGRRVRGFVPALERIERACLENDMTALEVEVEVLGDQLAAGGAGA